MSNRISTGDPLYDPLFNIYSVGNPRLFWYQNQRYFPVTDNGEVFFIHIPKGTPLPGDKSGRWDWYYGYTPKEPTP